MAEYIERSAAIEAAKHAWAKGLEPSQYIEALPAADVAPVVHGRWMEHYRSGVTVAEGGVSSCCDMWNDRRSNYCPNCGAKMDGGVDHEAD